MGKTTYTYDYLFVGFHLELCVNYSIIGAKIINLNSPGNSYFIK